MSEIWQSIFVLGAASLSIRLLGAELGHRLPSGGVFAEWLRAIPGCLIVALIASILARGGPVEWTGAAIAGLVAAFTHNLPATMLAGMAAVFVLRQWT